MFYFIFLETDKFRCMKSNHQKDDRKGKDSQLEKEKIYTS